ncbi:hypothetical protein SAMN04488056_1283 [Cohaesibacter marisflavi]|uniref:Uncharacterized protein n=1 Tax=Cohaesibacter marisflavi TaxID=655353 RepID=A0A1I5NBS4_9HYPH|nr:hypothetical protein [Cohaesibacter marisflavi]SFP18826.1 hypothetical protein SAMN04488056_1283 [Cohaesibacter marisflavi]
MESTSYQITPGWLPNPVFETALAFFEAAEAEYARETKKVGIFQLKRWFVVHHLSVLSVELFLKSFFVKVTYGPVASPDSPEIEAYKHAFLGHKASLKELPPDVVTLLKRYLPPHLHELMDDLDTNKITQGRYPYEQHEGKQRFPFGDDGQRLAEQWLSLARELSKFPDFYFSSPEFDDRTQIKGS